MKNYREWIEVNELFLELATWGTFDITEDDVMSCCLELEAIRSEMLTVSED